MSSLSFIYHIKILGQRGEWKLSIIDFILHKIIYLWKKMSTLHTWALDSWYIYIYIYIYIYDQYFYNIFTIFLHIYIYIYDQYFYKTNIIDKFTCPLGDHISFNNNNNNNNNNNILLHFSFNYSTTLFHSKECIFDCVLNLCCILCDLNEESIY